MGGWWIRILKQKIMASWSFRNLEKVLNCERFYEKKKNEIENHHRELKREQNSAQFTTRDKKNNEKYRKKLCWNYISESSSSITKNTDKIQDKPEPAISTNKTTIQAKSNVPSNQKHSLIKHTKTKNDRWRQLLNDPLVTIIQAENEGQQSARSNPVISANCKRYGFSPIQ